MARKRAAVRRTAPPRQQPRQPGRSGNPAKRARPGAAGGRPAGAGRPLPRGTSFYTPNASPARQRVERASAPLVVLFHRLPRPVFALLPLLLLVLGAFLPIVPVALVLLALDLLLLAWLAFLSWPQAEGLQRAMRLLVPALVIAIAVLRITRG